MGVNDVGFDNVADLKLNNPKLEKLCEILVEHFEREKVLGNSTRAIVFSQWRKSVEGTYYMKRFILVIIAWNLLYF